MKRIWIFIAAIFACAGIADAAVRDAKTVSRTDSQSTLVRNQSSNKQQKNITARTTAPNTVSRTTTTPRTTVRSATTARSTKNTTARSTTTARSAKTPTPARSATNTVRSASRPARATITLNTTQSNTFGTGYNTCRDAYFTCMDQFCSTANDTYRRCICSSKLPDVKARERALSQASDQLADFKNLNLSVIDKTANEVSAMLSASAGEYKQSTTTDKSDSASKLSGISDVLAKSKSQSLSMGGTLDIAGDINAIWATTDLTGGTNISNLTGEALYNAVHAQCSELVADKCPNSSTQTMVTSAYGMYIENDCSLLINELDRKLLSANSTIRATEREMNLARLDNYNAHNSTEINECIAQVRQDITANTACGTDYVHCLDITGRYLNYATGEPIYSSNFYQLESQISLSGDILTNQTNRLLIAELNRKRPFAARGLDTCRDIADQVWDEFVRQAVTEIYQGQQERIRQVKTECLNVVNTCYDEQQQSLKDFSNIKDQLLLGSRLELSEEMCREKLDACSNLYGGGSHGMQELLTAMHNITSQQIAKECLPTLQEYAKQLCAVPSNDTLHGYPYACRAYAPGDQIYANNNACNIRTISDIGIQSSGQNIGANINTCKLADHLKDPNACNCVANATATDDINCKCNQGFTAQNGECVEKTNTPTTNTGLSIETKQYVCKVTIRFTSCEPGYFLDDVPQTQNNTTPIVTQCYPCPEGYTCDGGTAEPTADGCPKGQYMTVDGEYDSEPDDEYQCSNCPAGQYCAGGKANHADKTTLTTCEKDYYLKNLDPDDPTQPNTNECAPCPQNHTCPGGADAPAIPKEEAEPECGEDYIGSLYHKMVRYAMQSCTRPSEANKPLPATVLQDINVIMDQIRVEMSTVLATECERLGGLWVDSVWIDKNPADAPDDIHDTTGHSLYKLFYSETSANTKWGYCAAIETKTESTEPDTESTESDSETAN